MDTLVTEIELFDKTFFHKSLDGVQILSETLQKGEVQSKTFGGGFEGSELEFGSLTEVTVSARGTEEVFSVAFDAAASGLPTVLMTDTLFEPTLPKVLFLKIPSCFWLRKTSWNWGRLDEVRKNWTNHNIRNLEFEPPPQFK